MMQPETYRVLELDAMKVNGLLQKPIPLTRVSIICWVCRLAYLEDVCRIDVTWRKDKSLPL
jgi:hypothetical protein